MKGSLWIIVGWVGFDFTYRGMLEVRAGIVAIGCSPNDIIRKGQDALRSALRALGRSDRP